MRNRLERLTARLGASKSGVVALTLDRHFATAGFVMLPGAR